MGLPGSEPRLEGGGVVQTGVIKHEHKLRGPGAGDGSGIHRINDESCIQGSFTGSVVQLVGRRIIETQHVQALAMAGPSGHMFARKLPAVGDSQGQAKPGFVAVKHVHVARFFCLLPPGQAFGLVGVVVRIMGLFQRMAEPSPRPTTLFKKRRNMRTE